MLENPPDPVTLTPSIAVTSGFVRPSSVGPCELYPAIVFVPASAALIAPTDSTPPPASDWARSELPCVSHMTLELVKSVRVLTSPTTMMFRFLSAPAFPCFQTRMSKYCVAPVVLVNLTRSSG